jgi:four helix bundle protein
MKHNFRELKIWKDSIEIVRSIYLLTSELPDDEKFGLKSQLQRCAVSVSSNIAEGSGRSTNKDFRNFLNISLSSSYELETQLIIVNELFQIEIVELIEKLHEVQRMIIGFKKTLEV